MKIFYILFCSILLLPPWLSPIQAAPGQFSLSLSGVASLPSFSQTIPANKGIGISVSGEYRFSELFAGGLTGGMVEFIAPTGISDMKTVWLDLFGRFYPLSESTLGEPYLQLGMGVSPHIEGLFGDYWPNYAAAQFGPEFQSDPAAIHWNAQAALGYLFKLDKDLGLDTGFPIRPLLATDEKRSPDVRDKGGDRLVI